MTTYTSPFTGDVIQPTDVSYAAYNPSSDLTLAWPVNGNVSQDTVARIMDITPTTSGISVLLPPANQVSVGQDTMIKNPSAYSLTIKDFDGNVITTIVAGQSRYIYLTDNSTSAGSWSSLAFGTGTSAPDASALAGLGLEAIGTTLNQTHPTSSVLSAYTFVDSDRAQLKMWAGGTDYGTLPAAATLGDNWFCLFKNNGSGTYNIYTTGTDTIDLASSKIFQPNEACVILCTGGEYVTVGFGTSTSFFFTALTKPVVNGSYTLSTAEATTIIQEYTGTLTGNVEVVYPPVVALYVVSNQTVAGSYTLTLTTGIPGSSTATVSAGNQATLVCDGTNFYNANTVQAGASVSALANGSAANPSLYFASEPSTGVYRPGAGWFGITILGTNIAGFNSGGLDVYGIGNFTGGILGGTF
ncbi:hypothetical protein EB001_04100 [bacterium]|nr:hypothetical protein [bacterium]